MNNFINYIQTLIDACKTSELEYNIYSQTKSDTFKTLDMSKINGIARVTSGDYTDVSGLVEANYAIKLSFNVPSVEDVLNSVLNDLELLQKYVIGKVFQNSVIANSNDETGSSAFSINAPVTYAYNNGTMGECFRIDLYVYVDYNASLLLANDVKYYIETGVDENNDATYEEIIAYGVVEGVSVNLDSTNPESEQGEIISHPQSYGRSITLTGPVIINSFIKNNILDHRFDKNFNVENRYNIQVYEGNTYIGTYSNLALTNDIKVTVTRGQVVTYSIRFVRGD